MLEINILYLISYITPLLRDLHWLPILKRIQFKILVLTFKILHRDAPGYLCELLNWYHPTRHLRSANTTSLVPCRSRTVKLGRRLMDTAAATLWNTLPDGIRCSPSVVIFKKHLKAYLFNILHFNYILTCFYIIVFIISFSPYLIFDHLL